MDHTSAYLEVRGFIIRGHRPNISLAAAEANYNAAVLPAYNGNGIDADGRQGSGPRRPHHLRIIDNQVFDHCGGGISIISGDYLTVAGNTVCSAPQETSIWAGLCGAPVKSGWCAAN